MLNVPRRRRPHAPPRHRPAAPATPPPTGLPPELLLRLARDARPAWVITLKLAGGRSMQYPEFGSRAQIVAALDKVLGPGGYKIEPAPKISD